MKNIRAKAEKYLIWVVSAAAAVGAIAGMVAEAVTKLLAQF